MKIGILTFHCAHNYGAVLQAYALQHYLLSLGHDVEIIDYRPEYLLRPYRLNITWRRFFSKKPLKCVQKFFGELFCFLPVRCIRYSKFNRFITHRLQLSRRVRGTHIPAGYDVYVVGSDQIWNPNITEGIDGVYFARFGFEKGRRKYVSYAASMEAVALSESDKARYSLLLRGLDSISVREKVLVDLLQPLTDKKIELVLDPTLLVDADVWNRLSVCPFPHRRYVLVYAVRGNDAILDMAGRMARQLGVGVLNLTAWVTEQRNKYQTASPEEFLGAIRHAELVLTTSFHGTVFSVLFNRPFYTVKLGAGNDSRSESLLEMLDLKQRMIPLTATDIHSDRSVDWDEVNGRLHEYRQKSRAFLHSALGSGE